MIDEYCETELVLFGELTSRGLEEYYSIISIQDEAGEWVLLKEVVKHEKQ